MAWLAAPTTMDAFTERHATLSASPGSPFVRWLVLQRRHAEGVDVLQGLKLTRSADGEQVTRVEDRDSLVDALAEVFGIDVRHRPAVDLDALWARVSAADAAHREAGSGA
jgi:N-hydroxyarylamine O-acetyltransferase